ncbi:MAG TPA: hypothetical protein VLK29_08400 [Luteimonas sp.]|nr:hypothetical protein [Luteimonas sp.]
MPTIDNRNDALRVLAQHFDTFDGAGPALASPFTSDVAPDLLPAASASFADGVVSEDDLRTVAGTEGFTTEQREAAAFLLGDDGLRQGIDGADAGGDLDGKMGRTALAAYIDVHRDALPPDIVAVADATAILGAGDVGLLDIAPGRVEALVARWSALPPGQRQGLLEALTQQDPGAAGSWLRPDAIAMVAEGAGLDAATTAALVEGVAATPSGIAAYIEGDVAAASRAYDEVARPLAWRIQALGGAMTPEQLQAAVAELTASLDARVGELNTRWRMDVPLFSEQLASAQEQLAEHGVALLQRFGVDGGPQSAQAQATLLASLAGSPEAQNAILAALSEPGRVPPEVLDQAIDVFAAIDLGSQAPGFANAVGQAYLAQAETAIAAVDPNVPATVEAARARIADIRASGLAGLLGVDAAALDATLVRLQALVPTQPVSIDEMTRRLEALNEAATTLEAGSNGAPVAQGLRLLGIAAGGVALFQSGSTLFDDPNPETGLRALADLVGIGHDATELMVNAGRLAGTGTTASTLGSAGLGKVLGAVGLVFGGVDLYRNIRDGDGAQAALTTAGLAGGALAAFGTASWAGPVGIAVGALAAAGSLGLNQYRKVEASNEFMDADSRRFLEHAGFSDDIASALVDQSGEGYSAVPLLLQYGSQRGLDAQQTVAWLAGMSRSQVDTLRDALHVTLDAVDGDLSKFTATSELDGAWTPGGFGGLVPPHSAAQVDTLLRSMGLEPPG